VVVTRLPDHEIKFSWQRGEPWLFSSES